VFAAAHLGHAVPLAQFLERRCVVEQIGQRIGVAGASGRVGVVLHEMQVSVHQMGIETGGHFQSLVTGVDGREHFFGRQ
jgi:hypothetical protein